MTAASLLMVPTLILYFNTWESKNNIFYYESSFMLIAATYVMILMVSGTVAHLEILTLLK